MKLKFLYLLVISIFATNFGMAQSTSDIQNLPKAYQLGPGDEITVSVINEKEYDFKTIVDRNGFIEVPFHETPILAKCKTEREVKTEISTLLAKYLRKPQLSLLVTEKSRPSVMIYGEVVKNTQVDLTRRMTLIEALAVAGGVREEAGGMVQVIRTQTPPCADGDVDWQPDPEDETNTRLRMYSLAAVSKGTADVNPVIYPGDIVVVLKAMPVYINGEVQNPQGILLKEGGTTLMDAIAKVGGIKREAKTKDIKIYRQKDGSKDREVISVNYDLIQKNQQKDPLLEPYDIIIVDKAKESLAKSILNVALGAGKAIVTSSSYNIGYRVVY